MWHYKYLNPNHPSHSPSNWVTSNTMPTLTVRFQTLPAKLGLDTPLASFLTRVLPLSSNRILGLSKYNWVSCLVDGAELWVSPERHAHYRFPQVVNPYSFVDLDLYISTDAMVRVCDHIAHNIGGTEYDTLGHLCSWVMPHPTRYTHVEAVAEVVSCALHMGKKPWEYTLSSLWDEVHLLRGSDVAV
jgi:hypothetical protein